MQREVLNLPEPAKTLLDATFHELDRTLADVVPDGERWRLGGGTLLAARWRHRKSTDVDIFLPENSGLGALDPRWNPAFAKAMSELGAERFDVQDRSFKLSFPSGRIEITQLDPRPDIAPALATVDGRDLAVYGNHHVLTGKLFGRGKRLPVRDVFDIAVARHEDLAALRVAVNYLDTNLRAEVVQSIRANAAVYAEEALDAIIDPAPQWHYLIHECAERAVDSIESATYERVEVRFRSGVAHLALATADGAETQLAYRSAADLALGMKSMGLERLMLRTHRSQADYVADTQQKLDRS